MTLDLENTLIVLLIVVLTKAGMSRYWLWRTRVLHAEYMEYLSRKRSEERKEKKKAFLFIERLPEVRELLKRAQIKDMRNTTVEFVGYGHVQPQTYTGFDNIAVDEPQIVAWVNDSFYEAAGHYKMGVREAFNPVFWIEIAGRAPGALAVLLGVGEDSRWVKVTNVAVWLPVILFLSFSLITGDPIHVNWKGKFGEIDIQGALPEPNIENDKKE